MLGIQIMKCVACGSASIVDGELVDMKGGKMGTFKLSGVPKCKSMFGVGVRGVRAYGCVNCQHLRSPSPVNTRES